jgi:Protein of unknown function (DUF3443)
MFKKLLVGLVVVGAPTLGGVGMTSAASALHVHEESMASTHPGGSAVVPVTVLDGQGTALGARPTVEVSVGDSSPVPVLLDTGSSGLHIFDNAVNTGPGSGVMLTSQPANITYSGGHRFTGVVANAVVTIGADATKVPIPFAYVENAFCTARKPNCPASGGVPGFEQSGMYGIMGIGTQESDGGIMSPIRGMPKTLRTKWSIHLDGASGSLTLGARLPSVRRSVTTIQMTQTGPSASGPLWADSDLPLCLSVGTADECVPGLFDSGTYTMQISGPMLDHVPTTPGTDHVVSGTPVAVALKRAPRPFWTFTSGTTKSEDLVTVKSDQGPFVNTGVQVFYEFSVTYDDITGQIRLSR